MKGLVIIPAYNEAQSLEKVILDIKQNAPSFDYIVINDCSSDGTMQLCKKKGFAALHLPINLGIGGAVQTGYAYAKKYEYDIAIQFDGDGQHDAKYLEEMKQMIIKKEADMIIGSRFIQKQGFQSSKMRRIGIRYFTILIQLLTRTKINDPTSGMRMVNRDIILLFANNYPKDYPEPECIITVLKEKKIIKEYPVIMRERETGVSSISVTKSIYYVIKVTIGILIERIRR